MKKIFIFPMVLISGISFCQVEIDQKIQLTGSGSSAKIEGIQAVTSAQDATSAESVQSGSLSYGAATGGGSNAFSVTLGPAPALLSTGMMIYFSADAAISGATTLDVNSLGAFPIKKNGSADLAANDIVGGQMVAVIYDGTNFQMISSVPAGGSGPKDCPSGYSAINKEYCISTSEQSAATFYNAISACRGTVSGGEAHLCSWSEWYGACSQSGVSPSLSSMTANGPEWIGDGNGDYQPEGFGSAMVVGDGSCDNSMYSNYDGKVKSGGWGAASQHEFRCCFNR